jgi:hypothetical protein
VLSNDSDPDGDTLTITTVDTPTSGIAAIRGQYIVYTPTVAYSGTATFNYTISDGQVTDTATVTVIVTTTPVEDTIEPPVITSGETISVTTNTLIISGTAEPESTVQLTIDLGSNGRVTNQTTANSGTARSESTAQVGNDAQVTYETLTDKQGNWSVDLAVATPIRGTMPEDGLAIGQYNLTVIARDADGNTSTLTNGTLVIQSSTTHWVFLPVVVR